MIRVSDVLRIIDGAKSNNADVLLRYLKHLVQMDDEEYAKVLDAVSKKLCGIDKRTVMDKVIEEKDTNEYGRDRDIVNVEMVYCSKEGPLSEPQPLKKCDNCLFFGGKNGSSIKCLYDASLLSNWAHVHALKFEDSRFTYESHRANELSDDEYEEYVGNGYDCCKWCCFNRKLSNGEEYCFLRSAISDDDRSAFICYEGEFFTATPKNKDNGED